MGIGLYRPRLSCWVGGNVTRGSTAQGQVGELPPTTVVTLDVLGRILGWDHGAEAIFGVSQAEAPGRLMIELLGPGELTARVADGLKGVRYRGLVSTPSMDRPARLLWLSVEPVGPQSGVTGGALVVMVDMTEHLNTRSTLARATSIIDSSNEIIIVADLDGRVQEWNRGAEMALGYSRQEMLGCETKTYIDPGDWDRLGELREKVLSGQEVREVLATLISSDDKAINVVISGLPVRDHTGAVVGVTTLSRDVTEGLRIRRELELSEARFKALHRNSSDVAIVVNAKGKMTYVSPALRALFDRSPEEVLFSSGLEFLDPADIPVVRQAFARVLAEPSERVRVQARTRDRSGIEHWVEMVLSNALDDPAIAGIVTNVRDITDRKKIELALAESEARFRGHFQYAAVGQAMTDVDGSLVEVNEAFCTITGYSREVLLGLRFSDITHPEDLADNLALVERLLAGQLPSFQLEKRYVRPDGSPVDVANSVSLIRDDSGRPRFITAVVIDISERKRAEAELERLALYDTLTGLPNRSLIHDRLDQALARGGRRGEKMGVIAMGVDRFKEVNSDLGRAAGDELLKAVADRLVGAVGEYGTVARTGGDEFLVVCEGVADESVSLTLGHKLVDAFEHPIHLDGQEAYLTVSAGVAMGVGGMSADRVVAQASAAMYRAKYLGRARVEAFAGPTSTFADGHVARFAALRRGLDRAELAVVYQPIICLADGSIVGAEALVRWDDPQRGRIGPDAFIGLAEETGLIGRLGAFVMDQACATLASWQGVQPGLGMAVNISGRQLAEPGLVDMVRATLAAHDLPPGCLTLEVTESVAMEDLDYTAETLESLRRIGCLLSIDDFGTGYSSVRNLRRLPFDSLKIDREFVSGLPEDPHDLAIVKAMIAMARALGLVTVAEGVETPEQDRMLREMGCQLAQGYLYSRPVDPQDWGQS